MKKLKLIFLTLLFANFLIAQDLGTDIGDKAIDLSYNNPNGEKMTLSEIKNKLVLIDSGHPGVVPVEEKIQI